MLVQRDGRGWLPEGKWGKVGYEEGSDGREGGCRGRREQYGVRRT